MFVIIVLPLMIMIPDILSKYTPKVFWPNPSDKIMHKVKVEKRNRSDHLNHVYPHAIGIDLNSVDMSGVADN